MKRLITFFAALLITVAAQAALNLNTAGVADLMEIKGLNKINATNIVNDRQINGPFEDFKDIDKRVKGIGKKHIQALKAAGAIVGSYEEYDEYGNYATTND